jgi:hypothetical protein
MTTKLRWRSLMVRLGMVPAAGAAALLMAGTAFAALPTWKLEQLPAPTSSHDPRVQDVSCPSATFCMAAGNNGGEGGSFSDSWNGTSWTLENIAAPAGDSMTAVSCLSATFCVGVGNVEQSQPIVFRWNGTKWSFKIVPMLAGDTSGFLEGVSCLSVSRCVAVGYGAPTSFSETWNGTSWTPSSMPGAGGGAANFFGGVSCVSSTSCFAVGGVNSGGNLADFWNGTSWTAQALPHESYFSGLGAVSCSSATACTAVGSYVGAHGAQALIYRWNGTDWAQQAAAGSQVRHVPQSNALEDVSCSPSACTAVGEEVFNNTQSEQIEHWNGTVWKRYPSFISTPQPGILTGVSCHTQRTCMAVGGLIAEQES